MGQDLLKETFIDTKSVNERLLQLSMATGYNCIQRNGQRYYGPPPNWSGSPPEKGSEIFVGRLPRDCFEDEFVPVFENVAPIYEARLMMNFTGYNRGFAFITYCNPVDAWRAVKMFNDYEIRPGHKLGVSKSIDNCRLYIGGIPSYKSKVEAFEEVLSICPTVKEIIMYPDQKDRRKNRGFLFAEFECHRMAAMAKRSMIPGTVKLWGMDIIVDWAVPEPDIDPQIMSSITKLFIRNLSPSFTAERIHRILHHVVPSIVIERVYVCGHYGFIHFNTREHAELAMKELVDVTIDGEALEVSWARPKMYKKPNSFISHCRSLPPRFRRDLEQQKNNDAEDDIDGFTVSHHIQQQSMLRTMTLSASPPTLQTVSPQPASQILSVSASHDMNNQPVVQIQQSVHEHNMNGNYKDMNMYTTMQYSYNPQVYMYTPNSLQYYHQ